MIIEYLLAIIVGYFLGSIPFALVIGKGFYKKDIRNYGSGNLGGGNTGRVLGKKAGLSAAIGHCYPIFARFKGGKAVATMYGFLFGMALFGPYDLRIFFIPLVVFLIVLYIGKIIALASMCSAAFITMYIGVTTTDRIMFGALCIFTILMIYRHRNNIVKMMRGQENKIRWM